jgi:hypothetical protein
MGGGGGLKVVRDSVGRSRSRRVRFRWKVIQIVLDQ